MPRTARISGSSVERLAALSIWEAQAIHEAVTGTAEAQGLKLGKLAQPLRVRAGFVSVRDLLKPSFEHIQRMFERQALVTGVPKSTFVAWQKPKAAIFVTLPGQVMLGGVASSTVNTATALVITLTELLTTTV